MTLVYAERVLILKSAQYREILCPYGTACKNGDIKKLHAVVCLNNKKLRELLDTVVEFRSVKER